MGGYDLSNAKFLFFYARGEKGDEQVEFKMGGISGDYGDSGEAGTGIIKLSKEWMLYKIDLRGKNLKNIIGGFCFMLNSKFNPEGLSFYLSEIYYSHKEQPENIFPLNKK